MLLREHDLQAAGSEPGAKVTAYLLDTPGDAGIKIQKRPLLIICPGGCYERLSFREGEPVVTHFLQQGFHVCLLQYSVAPATFPTQVLEVGETIKWIRSHAAAWKVDVDQLFLLGFSAGGHLAASYGIYWNQQFLSDQIGLSSAGLRPRGILLGYPVITTDPRYWHKETFQNLLGDKFDACVKTQSLEKQVTSSMPPCFLWHTAEDQTVPVENSLLMAMALRQAQVAFELHIFPEGEHGLSLANELVERPDGSGTQQEASQWIFLADAWLKVMCEQEEVGNKGEEKHE